MSEQDHRALALMLLKGIEAYHCLQAARQTLCRDRLSWDGDGLFASLDSKGRGGITENDLGQWLQRQGQGYSRAQIGMIFKILDRSHQGRISKEDFLIACLPTAPQEAQFAKRSYSSSSTSISQWKDEASRAQCTVNFCNFIKVLYQEYSELDESIASLENSPTPLEEIFLFIDKDRKGYARIQDIRALCEEYIDTKDRDIPILCSVFSIPDVLSLDRLREIVRDRKYNLCPVREYKDKENREIRERTAKERGRERENHPQMRGQASQVSQHGQMGYNGQSGQKGQTLQSGRVNPPNSRLALHSKCGSSTQSRCATTARSHPSIHSEEDLEAGYEGRDRDNGRGFGSGLAARMGATSPRGLYNFKTEEDGGDENDDCRYELRREKSVRVREDRSPHPYVMLGRKNIPVSRETSKEREQSISRSYAQGPLSRRGTISINNSPGKPLSSRGKSFGKDSLSNISTHSKNSIDREQSDAHFSNTVEQYQISLSGAQATSHGGQNSSRSHACCPTLHPERFLGINNPGRSEQKHILDVKLNMELFEDKGLEYFKQCQAKDFKGPFAPSPGNYLNRTGTRAPKTLLNTCCDKSNGKINVGKSSAEATDNSSPAMQNIKNRLWTLSQLKREAGIEAAKTSAKLEVSIEKLIILMGARTRRAMTREEFYLYQKRVKVNADPTVSDALFHYIDRDRDGLISAADFSHHLPGPLLPPTQTPAAYEDLSSDFRRALSDYLSTLSRIVSNALILKKEIPIVYGSFKTLSKAEIKELVRCCAEGRFVSNDDVEYIAEIIRT